MCFEGTTFVAFSCIKAAKGNRENSVDNIVSSPLAKNFLIVSLSPEHDYIKAQQETCVGPISCQRGHTLA